MIGALLLCGACIDFARTRNHLWLFAAGGALVAFGITWRILGLILKSLEEKKQPA